MIESHISLFCLVVSYISYSVYKTHEKKDFESSLVEFSSEMQWFPTNLEPWPIFVFLKFWCTPPVIINSYIFKILLQFIWRKLKRPLIWSQNKPHQNITMPHRWGMRPTLRITGVTSFTGVIVSVFKKYQNWSCIFKDRNEQLMKD